MEFNAENRSKFGVVVYSKSARESYKVDVYAPYATYKREMG